MSVTHYIVNVEVIICREGQYLTVIRSENEVHAPGALSFPGGKVEDAGVTQDILEETARREAEEEVGVTVSELAYVESKSFRADDGNQVIDIVFLARYLSGEPTPGDPDEVESLTWMTAEEIRQHPRSPDWTVDSITRAEDVRAHLEW